ncbi:hypothetical protein, partial [Mediterraneibacter gnavus]|uniref:hypothetical protein n=1 Tax=Mediterraneibacter gnavus TaxID=33038 RepID=UPI00321B35F5
HFHYTTHGIEVSFFYAKSRTCSFIVFKKHLIHILSIRWLVFEFAGSKGIGVRLQKDYEKLWGEVAKVLRVMMARSISSKIRFSRL